MRKRDMKRCISDVDAATSRMDAQLKIAADDGAAPSSKRCAIANAYAEATYIQRILQEALTAGS